MVPKAPPPPPAPKNFFQRFGDYLDSDEGKKRTVLLVFLFFTLAVVMSYLYYIESSKDLHLLKAVASIRQFAVEYDASLEGKTDMEVLAAVHRFTLQLLNWTLKNEELDKELKILVQVIPGFLAFEKNLYFFSNFRKSWDASRYDCLARHTADLVTCNLGEEQGLINEMVTKNKKDYWMGLIKNSSDSDEVTWINGEIPTETFWTRGQPDGGRRETCIVSAPPCSHKKCWHDAPCSELRYFCCKLAPKRIWMQ